MIKVLKILAALLLVVVLAMTAMVAWKLHPHENLQALPPQLISLASADGEARLQRSGAKVDFKSLSESYQAQKYISYCGVASSVSVLGALGKPTTQSSFFTSAASDVRSRMDVLFGGMSLPDLGGLLASHGLDVVFEHADSFDADAFRRIVKSNLVSDGDYLLVNYQREVLGQGRVGHISPLAAYDEESDSVLIMDTAEHKYPPTWVPIESLYAAMRTTDPSTGKMRGYTEVLGMTR